MIGVGADRAMQNFSAAELPAPVPVKPVVIDFPETGNEVARTVAAMTPTEPAKPKPIFVLDYDRRMFWPWAFFHAYGPMPKTFEIDSIEIGLNGAAEDDQGYIAVYKMHDYTYKSASAVFALVTKQRLMFVTERMPHSEFAYRFDGEFLHTDFEKLGGTNTVVLRGTLTKMKNGQTIAKRTVSFTAEHLGC
jgi:hypothetical protein